MTTQVNAKTAAFLLSEAGRTILEAIEAGKQLEFRDIGSTDGWYTPSAHVNTFNLNIELFEWRVKPEPRIAYVVVRNNGDLVQFCRTRASAEEHADVCNRNTFKQYHPYRVEEYRQVV